MFLFIFFVYLFKYLFFSQRNVTTIFQDKKRWMLCFTTIIPCGHEKTLSHNGLGQVGLISF